MTPLSVLTTLVLFCLAADDLIPVPSSAPAPAPVVRPVYVTDTTADRIPVRSPASYPAPAVYYGPVGGPNRLSVAQAQMPAAYAPPSLPAAGSVTAEVQSPAAYPPSLVPQGTAQPIGMRCESAVPAYVPQTGYAPQAGYLPQTSYAPVVVYRPVVPVVPMPESYYVGRGILGQATLYVPGQPIRNFFRYLAP